MPRLISVQDFAFRGRAGSLLGAVLLWGLPSFAFPAGVFVLHSNQPLEQAKTILYQTIKARTNMNSEIQISSGINWTN